MFTFSNSLFELLRIATLIIHLLIVKLMFFKDGGYFFRMFFVLTDFREIIFWLLFVGLRLLVLSYLFHQTIWLSFKWFQLLDQSSFFNSILLILLLLVLFRWMKVLHVRFLFNFMNNLYWFLFLLYSHYFLSNLFILFDLLIPIDLYFLIFLHCFNLFYLLDFFYRHNNSGLNELVLVFSFRQYEWNRNSMMNRFLFQLNNILFQLFILSNYLFLLDLLFDQVLGHVSEFSSELVISDLLRHFY